MRAICDAHGILLIADEVITAFGRTGAWTGSRLWGVQPDMMCTAKALTNGYFPFGAVMIGDRIARAFEADRTSFGSIGHGYTYSGHPVGAAAALATLEQLAKTNVATNAAARGAELMDGMVALKSKHALIGDVRGVGLMAAIELVGDQRSKSPASKAIVQRVQDGAYDAGVMVRTSGANIILSPPLVISSQDVASIIDALDAGLARATDA
jgi:adenosylmethionine-8-amino-7-oxononanoate aminotransferase